MACRSGERNLGGRHVLLARENRVVRSRTRRGGSDEEAPAASRKTGIKQSAVLHPKAAAANYFLHPEPLLLAAAKGHPEQPRSTREGSSGRRTHRPSLLKAFATIDGTSLGGLERNRRFLPTL